MTTSPWIDNLDDLSTENRKIIDNWLNDVHQNCIKEKTNCGCKKNVTGVGNFICDKCKKMFYSPSCENLKCLKKYADTIQPKKFVIGSVILEEITFPSCPHDLLRISFNYFPKQE